MEGYRPASGLGDRCRKRRSSHHILGRSSCGVDCRIVFRGYSHRDRNTGSAETANNVCRAVAVAGDCWLVEIRGKNTDGGAKKTRDACAPDDIAENIHRFVSERDRDPDDALVDVSKSSVRQWVLEAAEALAEEGHGRRWQQVSSHDLRRSWATYHMVERGVDVRTMMAVGGWSSYSAIEPYLAEPTEAKIGRVLKHGDTEPARLS